MTADTTTVTFHDVDVSAALDVVYRMNDLFDGLWSAGRLRSLMLADGGEEVVKAFTDVFISASRQLDDAAAAQRRRMTISVSVPARVRRVLIPFARRLVLLMADPETMDRIGFPPLEEAEMAMIDAFIGEAEGALIAS